MQSSTFWQSSPKVPLSKDDALRVVGEFVREYDEERLHSALGYVTPKDMLEGRQAEIHAARDQKLSEARERRAQERQEQRRMRVAEQSPACYTVESRSEDKALPGGNLSAESMPMARDGGVLTRIPAMPVPC